MADEDSSRRQFPHLSDDADALLDDVLLALSEAGDDEDQIMMIGVGELESLFHRGFEESLWPRIEDLARRDRAFRRALSAVWAYDSPMFERREELLRSLGESHDITVRFVAEPEGYPETTGYSWRAFDSDGPLRPDQLAGLLRQIATWLDRQSASDDGT